MCHVTGVVRHSWSNMQRFREGLVLKAHRLGSLNTSLESNEEEEDGQIEYA